MDKKYIQDLYNQLGGQAKFGSFEDFQSLITTDKNYQKDFHSSFGESTLGSFQDFSSLVSINKTQPVVQKKKFALDSSSEVGSSVLSSYIVLNQHNTGHISMLFISQSSRQLRSDSEISYHNK